MSEITETPLIGKLKKDDSWIRAFILTFVGVALEVAFLSSSFATDILRIVNDTTRNSFSIFLIDLYPLDLLSFALVLIFPIAYSVVSSLFFEVRRIVSPLYIQLGTVAVGSILILDGVFRSLYLPVASPFFPTLVIGYSFTVPISVIYMFLVGFIQTWVARWVVGSNFDGLAQVSYSVNLNSGRITDLLDKSIRIPLNLVRKDATNGVLLYEMSKGNNIAMLVLGADPVDHSKSIISIVMFKRGLYGIGKSDTSRDLGKVLEWALRGRLVSEESAADLTSLESSSLASEAAHSIALRYTHSKLKIGSESWSNIPTGYKTAIALTLFVMLAITAAFIQHFEGFEFNAYLDAIVVLFVALLAEIVLPLREELSRQRRTRASESQDPN